MCEHTPEILIGYLAMPGLYLMGIVSGLLLRVVTTKGEADETHQDHS